MISVAHRLSPILKTKEIQINNKNVYNSNSSIPVMAGFNNNQLADN